MSDETNKGCCGNAGDSSQDDASAGDRQKAGASAQDAFREKVEGLEQTIREKVREMEQIVRDGVRSIVPPDAEKHLRGAKREFLSAIRAFIDREIERSDRDAPKK